MNIADLFKEKLQNQSIETPPELWDRLETHLNNMGNSINQEIENNISTPDSQSIATSVAKAGGWKIAAIAAGSVATAGIIAFAVITNFNSGQDNMSGDRAQMNQPVEENTSNSSISQDTIDISENIYSSAKEEADVIPFPIPSSNNTSSSSPKNIDKPTNNNIFYQGNDQPLPGLSNSNETIAKVSEVENPAPALANTVVDNANTTVRETPEIKKEEPAITKNPVNTRQEESIPKEPAANQTNDFKLFIPNLITPNGDGANDLLVIKDLDKLTSYRLRITNKKGAKVLETTHYQNDWTGDHLPAGSYFYTIQFVFEGVEKVQYGIIEIIR